MYVKETGRKIRFAQPQTAASTTANVVSLGQATSHLTKGDFCTIQCTTGRMWFVGDTIETVLTSTDQNGWLMNAGDTIDFVTATSSIQTLSTGTAARFQLVVWES